MEIPVILGPTASGKTSVAARLARLMNGEVISADSRQVYRGMDIGSGKDLADYVVDGIRIPVHLIDICDPGYEYNIYEFRKDFGKAWKDITRRGKLPILCGGSGMYLGSVIQNYRLPDLVQDPELDTLLAGKTDAELIAFYESIRKPHNTTEYTDRNRLVKAVRLAIESARETRHDEPFPEIGFRVFGISWDRAVLRRRITDRLHARLDQGLVEEVKGLLDQGVPSNRLKAYGLEYKYVTLFLEGALSRDEMISQLNSAIHQFAKRQMTWFRGMERKGVSIEWLPGEPGPEACAEYIKSSLGGLIS